MYDETSDTGALLEGAGAGDQGARQHLLERYRERLRRMVALRLDPRLAQRLDPSDIIQESLADAARKLDDYLIKPPLPFYPWLHRLTTERLVQAHRFHLQSRKRDVDCEIRLGQDASMAGLADRFAASGTAPGDRIRRDEQRRYLIDALEMLSETDREVLVMRYLEGLGFGEISAALGITEGAAKVRHFRALERIRDRLGDDDEMMA